MTFFVFNYFYFSCFYFLVIVFREIIVGENTRVSGNSMTNINAD